MSPFYRCAAVCLLALSGCKVGYFHAETKLLLDGSIERAILQPAAGTPDAAMEPGLWEKTGWSRERSFRGFDGGIRDLPAARGKKEYFVAWTKAGSVDDLPKHFEKSAIDESFTSQFERQLERRDLGLLIEFTWKETLTDTVTLEDFRKARQEAVDLYCEILEPAWERSLGEEYDTSKLIECIQNEGAAFIFEVTDVAYDYERSLAQTLREKHQEETLKKLIIAVCEKHGFVGLLDENGTFQDEVAIQHATRIIGAVLVRRDGESLKPEEISTLLNGVKRTDEKSSTDSRFDKEWDRVIKSRPGGEKALKKQYENLSSRIGGVHRGLIPKSTEDFRFTMSFPGFVVQTNGILRAANQVRWQFHSFDAWPAGFTMTGQSLLDDSSSIKELQPWRQSLNPGSLTRLRDLVDEDVRLLGVLKKCREESHLTPLLDLENSSDDADLASLADRVLKLLLPVEGE
ncbi:MAG: hypothetical protein ACI8P0_002474 [Planctomycetaceae bacterium]|jgi:hypothetical protein